MSTLEAFGAAFALVGFIVFLVLTWMAAISNAEYENSLWLGLVFLGGAIICAWLFILSVT